ncbi:hypothetical protein VTJ04DRAFT_6763 [Mycothermus thermophilus]|uniref:uncharacterized protein n=1 Tax=Humicola insolens TaxID=85995 RepID=UPI003742ADCB
MSYPYPFKSWQAQLDEACREWNLAAPVFQIYSDRRGGRTAWSSQVIIGTHKFPARFWYDHKNVNNAKEDAAELAVKWFQSRSQTSSPASSRGKW